MLKNLFSSRKTKKSRLSLGGRTDGKSLMGLVSKKSETSSNGQMERRWSVVGSSWSRKKQSDRQREELIPLKNLSPVISMPCLVPNDSFSEDFLIRAPKDTDANDTLIEGEIVDKDFMKISKSEYEAIKERVSAIESRISQEFGNVQSSLMSSPEMETGLENVQDKYKKTLEETGSMSNFSSTDQLAKRLSRDLKIRRSAEHKIIRSPSARKIGTMRRRSRENATRLSRNQSWHVPVTRTTSIILPTQNIEQSSNDGTEISFYPKANLRRGRPNTVKMGLRHPSPAKKVSESEKEEEWTSGNDFFTKPENNVCNMSFDDDFELPKVVTPTSSIRKLSLRSAVTVTPPNFISKMNFDEMKTPMLPPNLPPRRTPLTITKTPMLPPRSHGKIINKALLTPLQDQQTGRASIARIRSQNAGMVAAKAKLFDGMADDSSEERKIQKSRKSSIRNSPKKSTPRRKNFKQSPNFIQRRQKIRLAKSPLALDNMIKCRQILTEISPFKDNLKEENFCTPTKEVFKKILKNNDIGLDVMTPPIKRALLIKSPKRIMNRERSQKTPMKVPRSSTEGEFSQFSLRSSPRFLHSSRPY